MCLPLRRSLIAQSTSCWSTNFGAEGSGKDKAFLELHLDSMLDPSEHFLGGEVFRAFPPVNAGLQLCRVE